MKKAFGHKFLVVSDVVQWMDTKKYLGGPWIHLATVKRGLKEYVAFRHAHSNKVYLEEIGTISGALTQIESDSEWMDLFGFLSEARLLELGSRREVSVGAMGLPGMQHGKE